MRGVGGGGGGREREREREREKKKKKKQNISICRLLKILPRVLSVKYQNSENTEYRCNNVIAIQVCINNSVFTRQDPSAKSQDSNMDQYGYCMVFFNA